jgi:hypothetical protein
MVMVYKDTLRYAFPLLLIMGREPNDTLEMGTKVGPYDFDEKELVEGKEMRRSRCVFWNMAYKLVGDLNGIDDLSVAGLKGKCRIAGTSPIIFADLSPRSIRSAVGNKPGQRLGILPAEFEKHFEAILGCEVIERIDLFLLPGSENDGLEGPRRKLEKQCGSVGKYAISIPFLSTYSYEKAKKRIQENVGVKKRITRIYREWAESLF